MFLGAFCCFIYAFGTHKQLSCVIRAADFLSVSITGHVTKRSMLTNCSLEELMFVTTLEKIRHTVFCICLKGRLLLTLAIPFALNRSMSLAVYLVGSEIEVESILLNVLALSVEREELSILALEFWRKNCKLCSIQNKIIRVSFYIN